MGIDDRELIGRVLAGQRDEFRVLVDRHQQSVLRFTSALLGDREEAQDMTQDAFLAAFANLSGYGLRRASLRHLCWGDDGTGFGRGLTTPNLGGIGTPRAVTTLVLKGTIFTPAMEESISQRLSR